MENNRFYIRDCNGVVVGNPKGYRTMRGAMQQASSRYSPVFRVLWRTYYDNETKNPNLDLIYSVALIDN